MEQGLAPLLLFILVAGGVAGLLLVLEKGLEDAPWRRPDPATANEQLEAERAQLEASEQQERQAAAHRAQEVKHAAYEAMVARVHSHARAHGAVLARKHIQMVHQDDYGNWVHGAWVKEIHYFLRTVVGMENLGEFVDDAVGIVDDIARDERQALEERSETGLVNPALLNPSEFEVACANALRRAGWGAVPTGRSGDQGCDILANKMAFTVVIQCKRYSSPVGNDAVQEAYAAKAHYSAFAACVVSDAPYTPAARRLASTTGVLLLHPTDLPRLGQLVGIDPVA